jgi:signal transduction histidine kinase
MRALLVTPKRSRLSGWASTLGSTFAGRASGADPGDGAMRARWSWRLLRTTVPPIWVGIVVAAVVIAGETFLAMLFQHRNPGEAFETLYLFGILLVSAVWGLWLALATSVASVAALAYFWPGGHFEPFSIDNGVIVVIFLIAAVFTSFVAGVARTRGIEAEESRDKLTVLASQQQALRRVATLVARGVNPSEVFATVTKEVGLLLAADITRLVRYEADGSGTVAAAWRRMGDPVPVGSRIPIGGIVAGPVRRSGKPARITEQSPPELPEGSYSAAGTPVLVAGKLWGAMTALSPQYRPLPEGTEARMAEFTDLVGTAIANAQDRADLMASRARIVTAADEARRRIERNLHDGAQQQLIALGMQVRTAQESAPTELVDLQAELSEVVSGLTSVSTELQQISRGIHPAILSEGGLGPALKSLGRRSTVPVSFDLAIEQRLPDVVEVAAYYVVAEALTNADKHAEASEVNVGANADDVNLHLSIRDDGIGGADSRKGSGLIGLKDRVEALGGHLQIVSHPGIGTSLDVTIPLEAGNSNHFAADRNDSFAKSVPKDEPP